MPLTDAKLIYHADQLCAPGGQMAFLVNNLSDASLKVTLRITTTTSGQSNVGENIIHLDPGQEQSVGCTLEGKTPPYIKLEFEIAGCERD